METILRVYGAYLVVLVLRAARVGGSVQFPREHDDSDYESTYEGPDGPLAVSVRYAPPETPLGGECFVRAPFPLICQIVRAIPPDTQVEVRHQGLYGDLTAYTGRSADVSTQIKEACETAEVLSRGGIGAAAMHDLVCLSAVKLDRILAEVQRLKEAQASESPKPAGWPTGPVFEEGQVKLVEPAESPELAEPADFCVSPEDFDDAASRARLGRINDFFGGLPEGDYLINEARKPGKPLQD